MFTELYLRTTSPNFQLVDFMRPDIVFPLTLSVLVHALIYLIFINLGYYCFTNRFLSNRMNFRWFSVLAMIMILGYIGRVFHVKDIYEAYGHNREKALKHVNQHYNSWIFLG
jgi:hypothetical protein